MHTPKDYYQSEDEIRAIVEGFESCALPPDSFDHRSHLTVAVWYLSNMTEGQTIARMREGLQRYLTHHGVDSQKYNETITQFWVMRLAKLLTQADSSLSRIERANQTLDLAGSSQLIFDYYTHQRVFSEEARTDWVEPDR